MAAMTSGPDFALNMTILSVKGLFDYDQVSVKPGTELKFFDASGDFAAFRGVGLAADLDGNVTGGRLRSIEVDDASAKIQFLVRGFEISAKQFYDLAIAGDSTGAKALVFAGGDNITGTNFDDKLLGFAGDDTVNGAGGRDLIQGADGKDFLIGLGGNDNLFGEIGDDRLAGGKGNDRLNGGIGKDFLTGGAGVDSFIFDVVPRAIDADRIFDFTPGVDKFILNSIAYSALPDGPLAASAFRILGTDANTAEWRIAYNPVNNRLLYDPDGSGVELPVNFAAVGPGVVLHNTDFTIL